MSSQKLSSYTGLRLDVASMVATRPKAILDVGCSNGTLLHYIKTHLGATYSVGIEFDSDFAREARSHADKIIETDLDNFSVRMLDGDKFDLIVLADVLEHTKEPAKVLSEVLKAASPGAEIMISLPNVQHWTAIKNLVIGRWPQRERGLFDETHLRFFTYRSIADLAESCGLHIEHVRRNLRIVDLPGARVNRLSRLFGFWPVRPFFTYQYVLRARKV